MSSSFLGQMNWADYFIIGVITLSTLISLARGFVKEAISLATWIIAIFIGIKFSAPLADLMSNIIETPSLRTATAFILLFLAVLILGGLINFLISHLVSKTGLNGTNRLVGSIFGIARGVLVVGLLIMLAKHTAIPQDPWWSESKLIPKFEPIAKTISDFMPEKVHKVSQILFEESPVTKAVQITDTVKG